MHFYGNSGVCLFKYLVHSTDSQVSFSLFVLILDFTCFLIISVCYLMVYSYAKTSSTSELGRKRNRVLQIKVGVIILTDFLTWVPFTIVCLLHYGEILDAQPWYSLFSTILLPINSVINPLLYDDTIGSMVKKSIRGFRVSS